MVASTVPAGTQQADLGTLLAGTVHAVVEAQDVLDEHARAQAAAFAAAPPGSLALPPLWFAFNDVSIVVEMSSEVVRRDDTVRATAQKAKVLKPESAPAPKESSNGHADSGASRVREDHPVTLRFAAGCDVGELRTVQKILASSPGAQPVTLIFTNGNGESVRIAAGEPFRIELTPMVEEPLARWL